MRNPIITIATSIALALSMNSCTDNTDAFIEKIEATQVELKQQDSFLVSYRAELSSIVFTDTTTKSSSPNDSLFNNLTQKINPLITRLELMIEKNKTLVEQVKNNTGNSREVEKKYAAQLDEYELIKIDISSAKDSFAQLVKIVGETFTSAMDSTKAK